MRFHYSAAMLAALAIVALATIGAETDDPTQIPDYPHGEFRGDCRQCHSPEQWKPAVIGPDFDHAKFGWPLDGAHANAPCMLCHLDLEFATTTGNDCSDCHEDVHMSELGLDCARCHSARSFIDRADDVRSHRFTQFPLLGAHATVDCVECHGPGGARFAGFANTPTECIACHRQDFQATTFPPHVEAGFSTDCLECHGDKVWGGSAFDHALTGFPLTGAHKPLDCTECHINFDFTPTSTDCFTCHQDDYLATTDPDHSQAGLPTACDVCHGTVAWRPAEFDHALTRFPLTGAHVSLNCGECHTSGQFASTSTDCYSCHQGAFEATTDPDHVAESLSTDCAECHNTATWF